jgi:hypothetical protein
MEAQSYSDRFPRHIMFSYRLPYLLNNTKMIKKYEKIEPEFPEILMTVFILRCVCSRGVQSMGGPSGKMGQKRIYRIRGGDGWLEQSGKTSEIPL